MNNFSLSKEADYVIYIRVIRQPQNIVVGEAGFSALVQSRKCNLWLKVPVYLNGNITSARDALAYSDVVDEDFHDFSC